MQRLKSRAQFQAVLGGQVISKTSHFAMHQLEVNPGDSIPGLFGSEEAWLGAMAPKRWAKRAVTRNMIKRQIYSVVSQVETPLAAYLVRLRTEFSKTEFVSATSMALKATVRQELYQLLNNARSMGQPLVMAQQISQLNQAASSLTKQHPSLIRRPLKLKQAVS